MFSTEKNAARVNYYVPLQDNDDYDYEVPPLKKQCFSASPKRRTARILSRRYALTSTGYKYLEIGLNVGPPSYVEIAIGDHRGNEMLMSLETWKGLYEQRLNIQICPRDRCEDISVGPLTVRFAKINNAKLVRLDLCNVRLTMTETTLFFMFTLDSCVDVMYNRLTKISDRIDAKYLQFSHIASAVADNRDVSAKIRASEYFDEKALIDCELLALAFGAT